MILCKRKEIPDVQVERSNSKAELYHQYFSKISHHRDSIRSTWTSGISFLCCTESLASFAYPVLSL